jgi:hypothetical protein
VASKIWLRPAAFDLGLGDAFIKGGHPAWVCIGYQAKMSSPFVSGSL